MTNIINSVLEKIKKGNIQPKPKWIFTLKNLLFWILVPILMLIAGLSFSIVIYMFVNNDWDLQPRVSNNFFEFLFKTAPYFWILILIIILIVFYFDFKKTKNGYKFEFVKIILLGISIIVISGIVFYLYGAGRYMDSSFMRKIPAYKNLSCPGAKMWNSPERGILAGKFVNIQDNSGSFKDAGGKTWNVTFDNKIELQKLDLNNDIKVIGIKLDDNKFYGESFREMRCGCTMKDCNCGNSERNFVDKRSNGCGVNIPTTNN